MKFIIFILLSAISIMHTSAQKIRGNADVKQFYTEYCLNAVKPNNNTVIFLNKYCSDELVKGWKEIDNSGLYDLFTKGYYDYEMIMNTITVERNNDHYNVSFKVKNPTNTLVREFVVIYVNDKGKICRVKRPEDGYMVPEK